MKLDQSTLDYCQQLFDKGQFRAELTLSNSPIPAYKKCLIQAQSKLDEDFANGVAIEILVQARAWLIDQVLSLAWEHWIGNDCEDIALVAVGGYGRGELHPHSDIDLLILLAHDSFAPYQQGIEAFITLLWDIRLAVGHSVRSITECCEQAAIDITIMTNLLESRTLCGPSQLILQLLDNIQAKQYWPSKKFLQAKYEEQRQRHKKFNETEYLLEPNLKSSPGGLRDIHMISWVSRHHFGINNLAQLVDQGLLTDSEYRILRSGRQYLWKVRYGLHLLAKRDENRLVFDYQKQLAQQFGYQDTHSSLAVEQFMQQYFRTVMALGELNDLLLQHFDDLILSADKPTTITRLNERFQINNNYIEVVSYHVFKEAPSALLEVFVLMTQHPEILGVKASTIRLIREHRYLIDDSFRCNPHNTALFIELMKAPYGLTVNLRRMMRYGILGRYLPAFGKITGQMQHDLFHIYTVDAHTLLLIKFLRSFHYQESKTRFPVATKIIKTLAKPELLYIAGLFHDIAKGRGGDHSELGAIEVEEFCKLHQLNEADTALVVWLVRFHLLMSSTAQRQDLSDPEVINRFAQQVSTATRLDYLYALTVADINATNPSLWNSWRASLLRQLYSATKQAFTRGLENPFGKHEQIQSTQQQAAALLTADGVKPDTIEKLWDDLGDEYFLRHTADEITWHCQGIINHKQRKPLILIKETTEQQTEATTQIFIYTKDREGLFAVLTAELDKLNLNVQDARIITSKTGYSLDTFIVLEQNGNPIGHKPYRIKQIKQHLVKALIRHNKNPTLINRRTPRQLKHFAYPAEVVISNDNKNQRTIIEITTPDRPGLIALIGKLFVDLKLVIHNAKIATLGERVEDVFLVTDLLGNPIKDEETCLQIQQTLCQHLDNRSQQDSIGKNQKRSLTIQ
ncbi:[protein-PII] uridylyltransferase [Spartinivicinus poritis]|uniref:Bifunctional uridylyltransferase/uridylyl-removing enzyme n=1 Tax=Spartinivicinus poritis TaxID=2994640 RepID=A0ABT5U206_9GAMM|nr:[protein-PII] uridylyltransferase [Spartinivicinus sp. A2-2]MDE1460402.1 [protein-PII] uridylyltransferase [Spartinivicinus sp. A2-2]